MIRRPFTALIVLVSLVIAACSGDAVEPEPPRPTFTTTSSTTTTIATTTTTVEPFVIADAPAELVTLVESFYDYASGDSTTLPVAPEPLLATITPAAAEVPRSGTAHLAVFKETPIAVVDMEADTFLAVDDGAGWRIVGGAWPSVSVQAYFGATPRHVAVVGSDARPGQAVAGSRADSIHFVGLDGTGAGAVVGLPRDSFVPIPGHGTRKVTTSLSLGGPETMMATFTGLTGIPFEGYVLTGFSGFQALLTSVLGGVTVDVPFAINDRWAHVNIGAGEQLLDGAEALGFARARKTVDGGDFTRSAHQGLILISVAGMVKQMGFVVIPELLELSEPHLLTDLTAEEILTFSAMAIAARPQAMSNVVAPGRAGSAGSQSVVFLSDSAAALWTDLSNGRLND